MLFTLGGGYSFRAAPRVWAILYLLMHDLPVVAGPSGVLAEKVAGRPRTTSSPRRFHDPNPVARRTFPNRYEISHRNRQVAERLLDLARPYWLPAVDASERCQASRAHGFGRISSPVAFSRG